MRRVYCVLTMAFSFSLGLVIGLVLHLPLAVAPVPRNVPHNVPSSPPQGHITAPHNVSVSVVAAGHRDPRQDPKQDPSLGPARPLNEDLGMTSGGLVEGVFWSAAAEARAPPGFTDEDVAEWRRRLATARVVGVSEGCGRMQNRLVELSDAWRACARYRLNTDQVQGELLSFHLSRVLGVHNVPPAVLLLPDPRRPQWSPVAAQLAQAGWSAARPALLTPFIDHLAPVYIPAALRSPTEPRLHPSTVEGQALTSDVGQLVQWSDLVVFDYLTGNLDRVVNNLYNLQWNAAMMSSPAHNLAVSPAGLLVLLDNESGLVHAYRLLHKYQPYHAALLRGLCVFRRRTARAIADLHRNNNVAAVLRAHYEADEPLWSLLPPLATANVNVLQQRVADVYRQIEYCKREYMTGES